ncbi:hypothetical protein I3760_07G213400 [Carya illinoinensis]|nr:hypothetical protein I3760_07G213400 [Carya illinoinensis]
MTPNICQKLDFNLSETRPKLKYNLLSGGNSSWKLVVDCKYDRSWGGWCTREGNGPIGVGIWRRIRRGWRAFANHTSLVVGEGTRIKFWNDIWCGEVALKDSFPLAFRVASDQEAAVADLMTLSGDQVQWNVTFTRAAQDWEIDNFEAFFHLLYSKKPNGLQVDTLWWIPTASPNSQFPWRRLWRNKAPPKALFFIWTAALGKILTTDNLRK